MLELYCDQHEEDEYIGIMQVLIRSIIQVDTFKQAWMKALSRQFFLLPLLRHSTRHFSNTREREETFVKDQTTTIYGERCPWRSTFLGYAFVSISFKYKNLRWMHKVIGKHHALDRVLMRYYLGPRSSIVGDR